MGGFVRRVPIPGDPTAAARLQRKSILEAPLEWLSPLALLFVYFAAYFLSTEVFHGRLGSTTYRIRLFRCEWHQRIFAPLLVIEEKVRPAEPQFSGQVHSGVSLPPPEEDGR